MAKILIVDDDPDITFATELFLKKAQHEVRTASNRADGMKAIEDGKPDLMILDVMMEQADDGIAMAQELRRAGVRLPILMLTSVGRVTGYELRPRRRPGAGGRLPREAGPARGPAGAKVRELLAAREGEARCS